jgi:hypothetical protein
MRILTPLWRSFRLSEQLLTGATIALIVASGHRLGVQTRRLPNLVRWWHGRLCRALGIRVEATGDLASNALLPHLARLVRHRGLRVRLHFLPPLEGGELSRREIAEYCRCAIAAALEVQTAPPQPCPTGPVGELPPSSAARVAQPT